MINTAGAYILILIFVEYNSGGLATHEMQNFESCRAAIVQLQPINGLRGYCIAKEVLP